MFRSATVGVLVNRIQYCSAAANDVIDERIDRRCRSRRMKASDAGQSTTVWYGGLVRLGTNSAAYMRVVVPGTSSSMSSRTQSGAVVSRDTIFAFSAVWS